MSLAADTREAVREHPFIYNALRAGLLNYSAAATWLADDAGLDGEADAIATALRRFREDLSTYSTEPRTASVSMRSGIGVDRTEPDESSATTAAEPAAESDAAPGADPLLQVGTTVVTDGGRETAILATGDVDAPALAAVLNRLTVADVRVTAAGVAGDSLVVVVGRRDGAAAVRAVESALESV